MITVDWKGGMVFEATSPSGLKFVMDAIPNAGGTDQGPTPIEALGAAVAACSAMDVVGILEKKRQPIDAYRIEVEWDRPPQGTFPRPMTRIVVRHILRGPKLDSDAVAQAVSLSDVKYCSVMATLRLGPTITSEFQIETE